MGEPVKPKAGVKSSEFGVAGAAMALVSTLEGIPGWARALALAIVAVGYCYIRMRTKGDGILAALEAGRQLLGKEKQDA